MLAKKLKPETIEDYIATIPPEVQERIYELHETITKAAPDATQSLKWNMPAYSHQKILVAFKVFKHHVGFYPMESAIKAFSKELDGYSKREGSVQFPLDKPLPLSLINKMVKFRIKESKAGTIKWKS